MTKQVLCVLSSILILASAAFAQSVEQQVGKIRGLYIDTNKRIETGLKDKTSGLHYAAWTVGGERDGQQWAAVGTMKTVTEYWFDGEPSFDREETGDARRLIRKIVANYTGGTGLRNRAEYIFDGGELVFAFTNELDPEGAPLERRFYYQKGKLIRVVSNGKNVDRNVGEEDRQLATNAQTEAKRRQNSFALMFAEE